MQWGSQSTLRESPTGPGARLVKTSAAGPGRHRVDLEAVRDGVQTSKGAAFEHGDGAVQLVGDVENRQARPGGDLCPLAGTAPPRPRWLRHPPLLMPVRTDI